ncbi:MAG: hypothetical protein KGJ62_08080 [Armatimonadetes bacterium]|nr:hypothetical protein [Armatimonadota bacterium]MDE2205234.1 hypothetical protein [Armatimonadota bacterium]
MTNSSRSGGISRRALLGGGAALAVSARSAVLPARADIGISLEGLGDGSRSKPFVDLARTLRPFTAADGAATLPVDALGWPLADCTTVLFDIRPFPAWNPPIDDPDAFQPDWSGAYLLSFSGQANVETGGDSTARVRSATYDAAANTTHAVLDVPRGCGLLTLTFRNTRLTPAGRTGSGIAHLHVLRPGTRAPVSATFTSEFLQSLKPFTTLRFMDWLDTNHNPGYYGDTGHHLTEWQARTPLDAATQQTTGAHVGAAWELVIELANTSGKDAWINIPVSATDQYVQSLASLMHAKLRSELRIFIEHSNEVWNFGFPQYIWNKLAAEEEVHAGGSRLNSDGSTDPEVWAHRRHAQRLVQIASIFQRTFGGAAGRRILPVYASWTISPQAYFADVLAWLTHAWGEPWRWLHGVASAAYFSGSSASAMASPEEILAVMRGASDANRKVRSQIGAIALQYGIGHLQYEAGPDNGGGSVVNVANRIRANRAPGMKDLIVRDVRDNWMALGGNTYIYFAGPSGGYSRYGCWGLSEDVADLHTPKWQAIYQVRR